MNNATRCALAVVLLHAGCSSASNSLIAAQQLCDSACTQALASLPTDEARAMPALRLKLADRLSITVLAATPANAADRMQRKGVVVPAIWPPTNRREFVAAVWPHARRAAQAIGVSAHALVAQAALESGWGKRLAAGIDGQPSFNLFGIKAGANWTGDRDRIATHEYVNGTRAARYADFRDYASLAEAFDDYVALLRRNPRYAAALRHSTDSRRFAAHLQKAGYSTDPHYADKIHSIANGQTLRRAMPTRSRRKSRTPQLIAMSETIRVEPSASSEYSPATGGRGIAEFGAALVKPLD